MNSNIKYGFTFSQKYAGELGLDWKQLFHDILRDFSFASVRVCAYWDLIGSKKSKFIFNDIDWQIQKASENGLDITLAFGRKVPRWPEYHDPQWAKESLRKNFLYYFKTMVNRYGNDKRIAQLQIENEPYFDFGISDSVILKEEFLEEINIARKVALKPVVTSASGEGESWDEIARYVDRLGINIYPIWYDGERKKYIHNLKSSEYFRKKAEGIKAQVFVAELQAEPWGPGSVYNLSKDEWEKSISVDKIINYIAIARDAGFKEIWLWGVEWWYFVKNQDSSMYKAMQRIINNRY